MHRSGECNCGAFARAEEERALMRTFWPQWWADTIEALEAKAEARGIRWCRWGGYDLQGKQAAGGPTDPGLLCANCPDGAEGHRSRRPSRRTRRGGVGRG